MKVVIDYKELENFLAYVEDKVEDVYEDEIRQSIKRFLSDRVTKMNSDIIK